MKNKKQKNGATGLPPSVENGWKIVTSFEDGKLIMESLLAGGSVFLIRPSHLELLTQWKNDTNRSSPIMPAVEFRSLKQFQLLRISSNLAEHLSPREQEVLELLAAGHFYWEVGKKLGIGKETVRTYVKNICSKMHVRNRIEAVAKYTSADGRKTAEADRMT